MDPITIAMTLAQFAPSVVRWLTGAAKAEQAAQTVVGVAQTVTGAGTAEKALEIIQSNTTAQLEFRRALAERETELDKLYLADVASARARDVEIRKASGGENRRQDVMIAAAAIGLIACLAVLVFFRKDIPGEAVGIISTVAGIFGACLKDAFAFEFGSSRGSKEKDALLGDIARLP